MYLPYNACLTRRSMTIVTVLSILLLITRPWTVRSGFAFSVATSFMTSSLVGGSALLLADQHGVDASDLATHAPDLVGLRELPGRLLHAQRELLLVQVDEVGGELGRGFL